MNENKTTKEHRTGSVCPMPAEPVDAVERGRIIRRTAAKSSGLGATKERPDLIRPERSAGPLPWLKRQRKPGKHEGCRLQADDSGGAY